MGVAKMGERLKRVDDIERASHQKTCPAMIIHKPGPRSNTL
jgi:hypothetical protein